MESTAKVKTPKHTETAEYGAVVRRMIGALGRRVGNGDIEDLALLMRAEETVQLALRAAVADLRDGQGYSWTDIGRGLGITRQAARQRFGTGEEG